MHNKSLTLLEILVAVLILALVMAGIANVFIASRRRLGQSRSKIQAAELGRLFLAPLQNQVRQDLWGKNCLSGKTEECPGPEKLGFTTYKPAYEITPVVIAGNTLPLQRVKVTITWDEPQSK
ncbi:MAG: type II secretion system protein [Candidatus Omnitrophica bacterium]|nr:type II secretion system protein [Candidatus Omnitrophota bacterium]MDD5592878.1 type II secretion system protein [Candidatus Omnitrophota bacterium]